MDVVYKEGLVYLQGVKFGKKTWRKIWMVLYKPSSTGVGRLQLYTVVDSTDQKKSGGHKSHVRKVVRLSDCLSVTSAPQQSCPSGCEAFVLNTISDKYILASASSQDWISALCQLAFQKDPEDADRGGFDRGNGVIMEDNDLYWSWESDSNIPPNIYQVTVRSTEASQRCNLVGDYLVSPEDETLLLLDNNTCNIIYRWPYKMLRKYGQVEGGFSIEAGRRCESGPGKFVFLSKQAQHIFEIICQQCSKDKTSTTPQLNTQPLFDQSTAHSGITSDPSVACSPFLPDSVSSPFDDKSSHCYDNLIDCFKELFVDRAHSRHSGGAVGEESEQEDDQRQFTEAQDTDGTTEESIYYNLPRAMSGRIDQFEAGHNSVLQDGYSEDFNSSIDPLLEEPTPVQLPCPVPKPRYHLQHNPVPPVYGAMETMKETEENIGSTGPITPLEAPGSFKHRLAEIISKDLAKFQAPAVPPGAASVTYPQY